MRTLTNTKSKKNKRFVIKIDKQNSWKRRERQKQLETLSNVLSSVPPVREMLVDFFQRTTIPGLNPLGFSFNIWYKMAWVCLFLLCLIVGIYQSSSIIVAFQKYPVSEITDREVHPKVKFPSVSVCLNSPIRWMNYSVEPGFSVVNNTLDEFLREQHPIFTSMSNDGYDHREMKLLEEMSKVNKTERIQLGYPIRMFVIKCSWDGKDCVPDLFLFNNLHFGSCFTFNPGFFKQRSLYAGKSKSLMIVVRSEFPDEFPYTLRDDVVFLSLHGPGTPPVLDRRRMQSLFPGRWLKIGITETLETKRLPWPYPSKCIDERETENQQKTFYYHPTTPYYYSVEACAETCLQNATINTCNCFTPIYPLPPGHPNKICHKEECPVSSDTNKCNCPKPCREVRHEFEITVDDRWLTQDIWVKWVKSLLTDENNVSLDATHVSGFEVFLSSTMHTNIEEEQKIQWADFLGSIGGNLSLWVGISIISIVEVVDLFFRLDPGTYF